VSDQDEFSEAQTTPKGAVIPVPQRDDVLDAFRKVARAAPDEQEPPESD